MKINPFTGKFDAVGNIPQLNYDPSSPIAEDSWILASRGGAGVGESYGLLLTLTNPGAISGYQFSYRTKEATTKRVTIS